MIFGKKKIADLIVKCFNEKKISYERDLNKISFVVSYSDFSIYPYLKINEDEETINILINIRKIENKENVFEKLNAFNLKSQFFKAISNDGVIILEYNAISTSDNVVDVLDLIIDSLASLREEIKEL